MVARERTGGGPGIRAYVGLGSNLSEPLNQIRVALLALGELTQTTLISCSDVYRNRAMIDSRQGVQTVQPDYLNAVAAVATRLPAEDLLRALLAQETAQGRRRSGAHWEARCIDLDLLLYGELKIETRILTVPHPGLVQRPFVIHPLAQIAPRAGIPGFGTASQVAKIVSKESLTLVCRGSVLLE